MQLARLSVTCLLLVGCQGADPTRPSIPSPAEPAFAAVDLFSDCSVSSAAPDVPAAVRDAIQAGIGPNYYDGQLAIVARRVPGGFGGYWVGADGRLTVALVDPGQREAALAALHGDPLLPRPVPLDAPVVQVRWNFAQLVEWDRYLGVTIGEEPDLTSVDRDEVANRLVIGVKTAAGRDRLVSTLRMRGAPCGLIRIKPDAGPVPAVGAANRASAT